MLQVLVAAPNEILKTLPIHGKGLGFTTANTGSSFLKSQEKIAATDVILLAYDLPGLSGMKGIREIRASIGKKPLGVLVPGLPLHQAGRLLATGADAVLPTNVAPDVFLPAISMLASGARFVVFGAAGQPGPLPDFEALSERELQVLEGICDGLQNKEIAHAFQIKEVTVKMHVRAIIRKLGANNRTHAAMIARDLGLF